ncbi:MAG TPA: MFS transporter [Actinomycetes bacterium]|nr:MFS transporter [Actinomycetes bacterium]
MSTGVQRRTIRTLSVVQILTGVGVASGVAAGSLLVAAVSGSEFLAGLAQTSGVIGAALAAVPLARLSSRRGRRAGLISGLVAATAGALVVITGAIVDQVVIILLGTLLVGVATAVGLQVRYAATDLATPVRIARDLSVVVWATTIGAVLGPNLLQPAADVADGLGLPPLSGPYLVTGAALALAAVVIAAALRPDPLLTARVNRGETKQPPHVNFKVALRIVRASFDATYGVLALAIGHCVMVMVMVMTPVHMQHVDVTLTVIGLVISVHILGMYAFSPLVGMVTDRAGPRRVIPVGAGILLTSTVIAGTASGDGVIQLGVGLFLLGLGWSFTLIAGSALLTESVAPADRPAAQGVGDTLMNVAAAVGGVVAGLVVNQASYGWLNVLAAVLVAGLLAVAVGRWAGSHAQRNRADQPSGVS